MPQYDSLDYYHTLWCYSMTVQFTAALSVMPQDDSLDYYHTLWCYSMTVQFTAALSVMPQDDSLDYYHTLWCYSMTVQFTAALSVMPQDDSLDYYHTLWCYRMTVQFTAALSVMPQDDSLDYYHTLCDATVWHLDRSGVQHWRCLSVQISSTHNYPLCGGKCFILYSIAFQLRYRVITVHIFSRCVGFLYNCLPQYSTGDYITYVGEWWWQFTKL